MTRVYNIGGDPNQDATNPPIKQGSTYTLAVKVWESAGVPRDLTGHTIRASIRRQFADSAVLISFTVLEDDLANGEFRLRLTAANTATLTGSGSPSANARLQSLGVYDCEDDDGAGDVKRLLEGAAFISLEATK